MSVFLAVAQWDWNGDQPTRYQSREFDTLAAAQQWAQQFGTDDPDALIKVYEGTYDRDGEFEETQDHYFDGDTWD